MRGRSRARIRVVESKRNEAYKRVQWLKGITRSGAVRNGKMMKYDRLRVRLRDELERAKRQTKAQFHAKIIQIGTLQLAFKRWP